MATFEPITKRDDPAEIAALAARYLAEKYSAPGSRLIHMTETDSWPVQE
jgi:hypothetical protein